SPFPYTTLFRSFGNWRVGQILFVVGGAGAHCCDGFIGCLAGIAADSVVGNHLLYPVWLFRFLVAKRFVACDLAPNSCTGDCNPCTDGRRVRGCARPAGALFRAYGALNFSRAGSCPADTAGLGSTCSRKTTDLGGLGYLAGWQYSHQS